MSIDNQKFAVIFDMDGVLIDNNSYHQIAWGNFCQNYKLMLSESELKQHVWGRTNKDVLRYLFKRDLSLEETNRYSEEKETIYRNMYKPYIKPVEGLLQFLSSLKINSIKMAVATSAPSTNLDFMLDNIDIAKFFDVLVDSSHVTNGKPNPEVYLKTAGLLDVKPKHCIVFEDSLSGVQAALNAEMKVIALTTTHVKTEFEKVSLVIKNFNCLDFNSLLALFQ